MLWLISLDFEWAWSRYPRWNWRVIIARTQRDAELKAVKWFEQVRGYPYSEAHGKKWCGLKVKRLWGS